MLGIGSSFKSRGQMSERQRSEGSNIRVGNHREEISESKKQRVALRNIQKLDARRWSPDPGFKITPSRF